MRIVAASFLTEDCAVEALEALDRRFRASASMKIAPLGHTSGTVGPSMVLAGAFEDDVIDAVRRSVSDLGGTVLVDAQEKT